jgi:hypothetical protein
MVADIETTIELIAAHGGEIVEPPVLGAPETIARFRDPAATSSGSTRRRRCRIAVDGLHVSLTRSRPFAPAGAGT